MKKKTNFLKYIIICFTVVLIFSIYYYYNTPVRKISYDNISSIEINETSYNKNIIYKIPDNSAEIQELINAYNKAKIWRDNGGTTPEIDVKINLKDGNNIYIGYGNGMLYKDINRKQYLIKGIELSNLLQKKLYAFNE